MTAAVASCVCVCVCVFTGYHGNCSGSVALTFIPSGDPRRPYPVDSEMRAGWLGRLTSNQPEKGFVPLNTVEKKKVQQDVVPMVPIQGTTDLPSPLAHVHHLFQYGLGMSYVGAEVGRHLGWFL